MRLRDLAGLIVVDFIDMEENRNNRAVEKRIKDALKNDRARIQVGRISHFGLLEMSRQRIRTGVLEGSTVVCEHCAGAGMVRSTSSIALHVLRLLEDALISDRSFDVVVRARSVVALYILNQKRAHLGELEIRFGVCVTFAADELLTGTTYCAVERGEPSTGVPQPSRLIPKYEFEAAEGTKPPSRRKTMSRKKQSKRRTRRLLKRLTIRMARDPVASVGDGGAAAIGRVRALPTTRLSRPMTRSASRPTSPAAPTAWMARVRAPDRWRSKPSAMTASALTTTRQRTGSEERSGGRGESRRRRSRRGGRRSREEGGERP